MVNEFIFNGLKIALFKGETLREAMMSFYNSGYLKQEIEEAARAVQIEQAQEKNFSNPPPENINPLIPSLSKKNFPEARHFNDIKNITPTNPRQEISDYKNEKGSNMTIKILLLFLLFVALALLGMIFLFKEEVINFFSKLL